MSIGAWQPPEVLHGDVVVDVVKFLQQDPDLSLLSGGVTAEAMYGYDSDLEWVSVTRVGGRQVGVFDRATCDVEVRAVLADRAFEIMQMVRRKFAVAPRHVHGLVGSVELYGPGKRTDAVHTLTVWGCSWEFTTRV